MYSTCTTQQHTKVSADKRVRDDRSEPVVVVVVLECDFDLPCMGRRRSFLVEVDAISGEHPSSNRPGLVLLYGQGRGRRARVVW